MFSETCPELNPGPNKLELQRCYRGSKNEKVDCKGEQLHGTFFQPKCKQYHSLLGEDGFLTCKENGEWDKVLPTCRLRNDAPTGYKDPTPNGSCNIPFSPEKSVIVLEDSDVRSNISIGETALSVEVTCKPGYALPNGGRIQKSSCFRKEEWYPTLKPCLSK
jgi:hypothetical protein